MQDHLSTCQSILSTKILFLKISFFQNFVLFYFIFFKKKFSEIFLLFTVTVHSYCSPYCSRPKLQYNNCIAIQFSAPCPFLATIHHVYYNTQQNNSPSSHNTIQVLQYNFPLHTSILQYNFLASFPCNILLYIVIQFPSIFFSTIQPIAYKTRS